MVTRLASVHCTVTGIFFNDTIHCIVYSPIYAVTDIIHLTLASYIFLSSGWSAIRSSWARRGGGAWKEGDGRKTLPFEEKKGDYDLDEMVGWNEWGWIKRCHCWRDGTKDVTISIKMSQFPSQITPGLSFSGDKYKIL